MHQNLPKEEWQKQLPKKTVVSKVIMQNDSGEWLLVKPSYKPKWQLPGGDADLHESPRLAAIRELKEEIGISPKGLKLLFVDIVTGDNPNADEIFFYWSSELSSDDINKIAIDNDEITEFKFVKPLEAPAMLGPKVSQRLQSYNSLNPQDQLKVAYMEDGAVK